MQALAGLVERFIHAILRTRMSFPYKLCRSPPFHLFHAGGPVSEACAVEIEILDEHGHDAAAV